MRCISVQEKGLKKQASIPQNKKQDDNFHKRISANIEPIYTKQGQSLKSYTTPKPLPLKSHTEPNTHVLIIRSVKYEKE